MSGWNYRPTTGSVMKIRQEQQDNDPEYVSLEYAKDQGSEDRAEYFKQTTEASRMQAGRRSRGSILGLA